MYTIYPHIYYVCISYICIENLYTTIYIYTHINIQKTYSFITDF